MTADSGQLVLCTEKHERSEKGIFRGMLKGVCIKSLGVGIGGTLGY